MTVPLHPARDEACFVQPLRYHLTSCPIWCLFLAPSGQHDRCKLNFSAGTFCEIPAIEARLVSPIFLESCPDCGQAIGKPYEGHHDHICPDCGQELPIPVPE